MVLPHVQAAFQQAEICDSGDHIIWFLPVPRARHTAWHLGGAQKYLLLPLNFSS